MLNFVKKTQPQTDKLLKISLLLLLAGTTSCGVKKDPLASRKPIENINNSSGDQNSIIASSAQAFREAMADLNTQENKQNIRYISLMHLKESGAADNELALLKKATIKLLNSLSWQPKLVAPQAIGSQNLIFRLQLSDFGWTPEQWSKVAAAHPAFSSGAEAAQLQDSAGTDKPLIHADWFVKTASLPPLYFDLLNLPLFLNDLTKRLSVNLDENIKSARVQRSGFDNSLVSANHRIAERHQPPQGFLWRTHEFGSIAGQQNIFSSPLGPSPESGMPMQQNSTNTNNSSTTNGLTPGNLMVAVFGGTKAGSTEFRSDGSEVIYTLPNGMLGFFVADGIGKRLDEVPVDKGKDPIRTGFDCMRCHFKGVINRQDMVRTKMIDSYSSDVREKVKALYVEHAKFEELINKDNEIYGKTLNQIGINPNDPDPINQAMGPK